MGDTNTDIVAAVGKLSEAVEWVERARGHLYEFHQMMGHADFTFGEAADRLEEAGAPAAADQVRREVVGRNVVDGRWTFEVIEEFDDGYWSVVRDLRAGVAAEHTGGRVHAHEAALKAERHKPGQP